MRITQYDLGMFASVAIFFVEYWIYENTRSFVICIVVAFLILQALRHLAKKLPRQE